MVYTGGLNTVQSACAMSTIAILASTPSAAIVPKSLVPLGTAAFAIPLCFNFIVTGLIIWRIWVLGRQSQAALRRAGAAIMPRSFARDAVAVVIESGMVYLVVQLVFTVLFAINHPAQILLSDVATQIYVSWIFQKKERYLKPSTDCDRVSLRL